MYLKAEIEKLPWHRILRKLEHTLDRYNLLCRAYENKLKKSIDPDTPEWDKVWKKLAAAREAVDQISYCVVLAKMCKPDFYHFNSCPMYYALPKICLALEKYCSDEGLQDTHDS